MDIYAYCLIVFWVGVIFGVFSNEEPFPLILPAIVTLFSVLYWTVKGLGWV